MREVPELAPVPEGRLAETIAQGHCGAVFFCGCEDIGHPDETSCVAAVQDDIRKRQQVSRASGLSYDAECAGIRYVRFYAPQCYTPVAAMVRGFYTCLPCTPYYGDLAVGEACTVLANGEDECAQDLRCREGRCEVACPPFADPGEACLGAGDARVAVCRYGHYCDPTTKTCLELPDGEKPCSRTSGCGADHYCELVGAEVVGKCVPAPPAGEPCREGRCDWRAFCDTSDADNPTCADKLDDGEECSTRHHDSCSSDLCIGGRCTRSWPPYVCF